MCPSNLRVVPNNYILLSLFTVCESIIVASVCILTSTEIVIMAALFTLGITLALTVYAYTTDSDFTGFGAMLHVFLISMIIFGFFAIFTDNNLVHIIMCLLGVLLFSVYIIYDT